MIQILLSGIAILFVMSLAFFFGKVVMHCLSIQQDGVAECMLLGFFSYFTVCQIILLPLVLLQKNLDVCVGGYWLGVLMIIVIYAFLLLRKKIYSPLEDLMMLKEQWWIKLLLFGAVCFVVSGAVFQIVDGFDTGFYVGQINESLSTGRIYAYDGNTGWLNDQLPMRYALSMYYVSYTVVAAIFHLEARVVAFYVMKPLCIIFASLLVYVLGKTITETRKYAAIMVALWLFLQYFVVADHSTSFFLLVRGYEAKAVCANIVLPACLWAIFCLFKSNGARDDWFRLGLIAYASVPMSMSTLAIVPAVIAVMGIVLMITQKKVCSNFIRCVACVVPNVIYFVLFFLNTQGIFVIEVAKI